MFNPKTISAVFAIYCLRSREYLQPSELYLITRGRVLLLILA